MDRIPWNKGKKGLQKHTDHWKSLMSKKMKGRKITWGDKISKSKMGHSVSKKTRNKISKSHIGIKHTKETKIKIGLAGKGRPSWIKGKKHSEETKKKIREKTIINGNRPPVMMGKDNPKWISDRSKLKKSQKRNDSAYQNWSKNVKCRDGWKCKMKDKNCSGKLISHHIYPWSKYKKLRYNLDNGITLCKYHHPKTRREEKLFINIFKELIK